MFCDESIELIEKRKRDESSGFFVQTFLEHDFGFGEGKVEWMEKRKRNDSSWLFVQTFLEIGTGF